MTDYHQQDHRRQDGGNERQADLVGGAGAAQVEQTSLKAHLPGVLPQSLPDGADFHLTVGQRVEGTRMEGFPVPVWQTEDHQINTTQHRLPFHTGFVPATARRRALAVVD